MDASINPDYSARIERFDVEAYYYNEFDISRVANAWQNYYRSNSIVGISSYGFVIKPYSNTCTVYGASSHTGLNPPYYIFNYKTDSDFTSFYSEGKYNDVSSDDENPNNEIYNFEGRMNCYAYALQIYDRNHVNGSEPHKLLPGELSLSDNSQFSTFTQLHNYYLSISNTADLQDFAEQQMMRDSQVMGSNLQKFTLSNSNQFELPAGFSGNAQRIIAMHTGANSYETVFDFHFYMRHGNGTCEQHGGTCSVWSHKRGSSFVFNDINNTIICDQNIISLTDDVTFYNSMNNSMEYDTPLRFYTIQQDLNVYNSWYEYNSNTDTTLYVS